MEAPYQHSGILLLAFGGPNSLDEVEPFLKNVYSGRPLNPFFVQQVRERYQHIGGKSPLLSITERQARSLQNNLKKMGKPCEVNIGMRYWRPSIPEAIKAFQTKGIKKVLCLILSPFVIKAVSGGYYEAVDQTVKESRNSIEAHFVLPWNTNALYLDAVAAKLKEGFAFFSLNEGHGAPLIFTAHSLPVHWLGNDPYRDMINQTISGVMERLASHDWYLAFQSRGSGKGKWLSPDVGEVLEILATRGEKDVLVVPLGFVSDHLETLYDLDIVLRKKAHDLGINLQRAPSLNDSQKFIEALTEVVITSSNNW